jgi:hypothetical protein
MSAKTATRKKSTKRADLNCVECKKKIAAVDQALFVEEGVNRYFCSEPCIVRHFTPDIEKLEREYGRHVSANDLSSEERERYAHLRWMNLENPTEVWKEKVKPGDDRYTLIAEFQPETKPVWAVAICLMLRGDPSFLYLAFVTSDRHLVDVFRRGERMRIVKNGDEPTTHVVAEAEVAEVESAPVSLARTAHLAEPWTESDSVRANLLTARKESDIPTEDFGFYQKCLEETLQNPNELWSYLPKSAKRIYHFLKHYDHDGSFWYVVIAKDTVDETQIEIVDVFPTRDESLIALCRHGKKEVLGSASAAGGGEAELAPTGSDGSGGRNVH